MASLQDLIIQGLKKPCEHQFEKFDLYKYEWETVKLSSNWMNDFARLLSNTSKKAKSKRWIIDCPICGKLWIAQTSKQEVLRLIKQMNKSYNLIDVKDSIRQKAKKEEK